MTVETTAIGDVRVIVCAGSVTLNDGRDTMVATVDRLLEQGVRWLVLDLRQVPYMDSSGIGGMMLCVRHAAQQGGEVRLVATPGGKVRQLLTLAGLDEVLRIFDDTDDVALRFPARA